MGSGSLNAMAVFEASYKEDMTQQEAESLVARAIRSGAYANSVLIKQHFVCCPAPVSLFAAIGTCSVCTTLMRSI